MVGKLNVFCKCLLHMTLIVIMIKKEKVLDGGV